MNLKFALIGLTVAALVRFDVCQSTDSKSATPATKPAATDTKSTPRIDERQGQPGEAHRAGGARSPAS